MSQGPFDEKQMVESNVVRITRLAHPTDQGAPTSTLENAVRSTLESMIAYGEKRAEEEVEANGFGNIKSGKKLARKLRQTYQRELRDAAQDRTDRLYKTFEDHIRPKPFLIPGPVWRVIQRVVLQHYI